MRVILIVLALLLGTPAFAQQSPQQHDPAFLQKVIGTLERQRNAAQNEAVVAQARAEQLADDLAKAQARIKELAPEK